MEVDWASLPATLSDTNLKTTRVFMQRFQDSKYRAPLMLREMARAGQLGREKGKGHYYRTDSCEAKRMQTLHHTSRTERE